MPKDTLEVFGKCHRCGGSGPDKPAASLTTADAQGNLNTLAQGEILTYFEGILMCDYCIQSEKNRRQSIMSADRHAEEESFRARVGFKRTVS